MSAPKSTKQALAAIGGQRAQLRYRRREEHHQNVTVVQSYLVFGIVTWALLVLFDVAHARLVHPVPLGPMLALRASGTGIQILTIVLLRSSFAKRPRGLLAVFSGSGVLINAIIGVQTAMTGGARSLYPVVLPLVMAGFAMVPMPRWEAFLSMVPVALVPWAVALVSPDVRASLADPEALFRIGAFVLVEIACGALFVISGSVSWELRRKVFESRSLGRYKLKRRLGEGGMGEVWAAYDTAMKREVALKILKADDNGDKAVVRFEREVRAMAELSHPNTVRIYDFDATRDGLRYYAMELLEGRTLADVVESDGPLSVRRAIHVASQAARALAEAHRRGIVHRDVKPANLFLTSAGGETDFLKLLDFGIARVANDDAAMTADGRVAGTPLFMSPEAVAGRDVDARGDVYSLGATLYFLLTGTPPFLGETSKDVMNGHLHGEVVPPSERRHAPIPPELEAIVMRCLAKKRSERYADAAALADALADCGGAVEATWRSSRGMAQGTVQSSNELGR